MPSREDDEAAANEPAPWMRRYVAFLSRNALVIAVAALLLFVGSLALAVRLQLRADLKELLPQDDPSLVELKALGDRVEQPSSLIVAVDSGDQKANEAFADALGQNLQPLVGTDLSAIDYRADAAKDYFEHNKALYADTNDLARIDDDFKKLLHIKKNPMAFSIADPTLGEEDDDPEADLKDLKAELQKRKDDADKFPSGYYERVDAVNGQPDYLLAVVTWARSSGDRTGNQIRDDVQHIIDQTNPAGYGVTAAITGDVESAIEEHDALKSDIELVSALCTVLVLLVIVLYYRSLLSIPHIFFPTLLGVAVAFGITELAIGYLNTNTAFLGSIILGNGINFGIILLARYHEERARGAEVEESLSRAIWRTAQPTLAAALAAGIAYGSLGLTRFRGFKQFGFVGGVGMVLVWLVTYSYCPTLIFLWERWRKKPRHPKASIGSGRLTGLATRLLGARKTTLAVITGVTVLAGFSLAQVVRDPIEYDFSKLRNQESKKHGAGSLYVRVGSIFPQDISPSAFTIVPALAEAEPYREALLTKDCVEAQNRWNQDPLADTLSLWSRDPTLVADRYALAKVADDPSKLAQACEARVVAGQPSLGILSNVRTAYQVLPSDQDAKMVILDRLQKRLSDPAMDLLDDDERQSVTDWAPPADLHVLTPADLPPSLARPYKELDGTVGRVALIFPVRGFRGWDGRNLLRLADLISGVTLPDGTVVNAGGNSSIFAAMLRAIAHDGPIASGIALFGVVLLVFLVFRRLRPALLVLASLAVGVIWMGGVGAAIGLKLNFLNFIALPVTLGIGVDYAMNVFARLGREPESAWPHALAETGSAVALCSSTTIIGYSSLLIASNGALQSFGKLADLGEAGCLLAALLLVPAIVPHRKRAAVATTGSATEDPGKAGPPEAAPKDSIGAADRS
jgi:predicted RND superfamily exporter protein